MSEIYEASEGRYTERVLFDELCNGDVATILADDLLIGTWDMLSVVRRPRTEADQMYARACETIREGKEY